MEGSRLYRELRDSARSFYSSSRDDVCEENGVSEVYGKSMEGLLETPVEGWLLASRGKEDSEDWLQVTPESLDDMLAARFGVAADGGETGKIPVEVDKFLKKVSDMAGVEMKGEKTEEGIDFDPDQLVNSMKKLLNEDFDGKEDFDDGDVNEDHVCCVDSDEDWEPDHVMADYKEKVGENMPDINQSLNVDSSVLANLLASYQAQGGMSGPAASLLHPLGINPRIKAENYENLEKPP